MVSGVLARQLRPHDKAPNTKNIHQPNSVLLVVLPPGLPGLTRGGLGDAISTARILRTHGQGTTWPGRYALVLVLGREYPHRKIVEEHAAAPTATATTTDLNLSLPVSSQHGVRAPVGVLARDLSDSPHRVLGRHPHSPSSLPKQAMRRRGLYAEIGRCRFYCRRVYTALKQALQ